MPIILRWVLFSSLVFPLALSGCATSRNPVPPDLISKATVDGTADIRTFVGMPNAKFEEDILLSFKQEDPKDYPKRPDGSVFYPVLAISGGAANGAYGAGLIKGWTRHGDRPVFKVVTGVSTGALIAPFAFLGSDYDDELEQCYTTMATKNVMSSRGVIGPLVGDSVYDTAPLAKKIASIATKELLGKIAAEHRKGRRLLVGTTNLDAQRFVVWNMGAIACKGDVELFRKVTLASASLPVVFPPVHIKVEADGKPYDELHVDGGAITQVFSTYRLLSNVDDAARAMGLDPAKMNATLYLIRNGFVVPHYKKTSDRLQPIADRTLFTILDAMGVGDIFRVYVYMKKSENEFKLAYIPVDFAPENKEMFDIKDMTRMFNRGYEDAANGYDWKTEPPGVDRGETKHSQ
jgi:predicted acylesterase/phospholipase RssA